MQGSRKRLTRTQLLLEHAGHELEAAPPSSQRVSSLQPHRSVLEPLQTLDDSKWRVGEGGQEAGGTNDKTIVEHYTCTYSPRLPATRSNAPSQTTL